MKHLLFALVLFLPLATFAQELSTDEDIPNRYSYTPYHWNKTNLSYYIYNTSSHLTSQERNNAIQTALNKWSLYTSFTFEETTVPANADIVFMWVTGEHGDEDPFGPDSSTSAHMKPEHSGYNMTKANIHYNDYKNWVVKVEPDNNEIDLVHTTLHEVGHALGLDHSDLYASIMYQGKREGRDLYYDDLQGIWSIYGCPFIIEGPSTVCSLAQYSISLPSKLSVAFDASGALTEISPIGSFRYLVEKSTDGIGCISATLIYDYNINTWVINKGNIGVGSPDLGMDIIFETSTGISGCWASNMINNTFSLTNNLSVAYDRVEAQLYRMDNNFNPTQLVQSWYNINTTGGASINGSTPGWYLFKLRGVSDCGYSDWLEQEVEMVDFSMLSFLLVYDAASETLTLTLIEPDSQNAQGAEASSQSITRGTYEIQLWNGIFSTMARSYKTDLTKYQMSLAGLPRGVYIVRVVLDGKTYSKKFVKR